MKIMNSKSFIAGYKSIIARAYNSLEYMKTQENKEQIDDALKRIDEADTQKGKEPIAIKFIKSQIRKTKKKNTEPIILGRKIAMFDIAEKFFGIDNIYANSLLYITKDFETNKISLILETKKGDEIDQKEYIIYLGDKEENEPEK